MPVFASCIFCSLGNEKKIHWTILFKQNWYFQSGLHNFWNGDFWNTQQIFGRYWIWYKKRQKILWLSSSTSYQSNHITFLFPQRKFKIWIYLELSHFSRRKVIQHLERNAHLEWWRTKFCQKSFRTTSHSAFHQPKDSFHNCLENFMAIKFI